MKQELKRGMFMIMKTEKVLIATTGEEAEVKIPYGINSKTFDLIAPMIDADETSNPKKDNDRVRFIVDHVIISPDNFDWMEIDVNDIWRLMRDFVTPLLNKFQQGDGSGTDGSTVSVSVNTSGSKRRPLPRPNRKKLSEPSEDSGPL